MIDRARVQVSVWKGAELQSNLEAVAGLRIKVFQDFPYLYQGSLEYEKKYLQVYLQSSRSVWVAVKDRDHLVGVSSAIPLEDETEEVKSPFAKAGFILSEIFYFGESILLSQYRGLGIGNLFFDEREKAALKYPQFNKTCFCAVERPSDHPLKPKGYLPLHGFWNKRGYVIRPELQTHFSWQDLGESVETQKPMTFWMKEWKR